MKLKIFICAVAVFAVSLIAYSQLKTEAFAPAGDFPRGALVYVQIEDLPALIKLWNESEIKKKLSRKSKFCGIFQQSSRQKTGEPLERI